MSTVLDGGCLCGDVRYRIREHEGEVSLCHCINCRRSSGAPFVAWLTVPRHSLEWTRHVPTAYDHASDLSPHVRRTFCSRCGSSLTWECIGAHTVDVTVGTLDDPEAVAPTRHTFASRQLKWLHLVDDLPRFEKGSGD